MTNYQPAQPTSDRPYRHYIGSSEGEALWEFLLDYKAVLQANGGYTLTGLNFKSRDDGWLLVVTAEKAGIHWVKFYGGKLFEHCLEQMFDDWEHGLISWKKDKFRNGT